MITAAHRIAKRLFDDDRGNIEKSAAAFLRVLAVVFVVVAALGLAVPTLLFSQVGIELTDAAGFAEIRAAYGGLFGGFGIVFYFAAQRRHLVPLGIAAASVVLGVFVVGRALSAFVDGAPTPPACFAWAVESAGWAVAAVLLIALSSSERRRSTHE